MRILIAAPWFRTLGRIHQQELQAAGHEVLLVTTAAQGDRSVAGAGAEIVLPARLRSLGSARSTAAALRRVRRFRPQAALLDATWDVRFQLLAAAAPTRAVLVHDARPHDAQHERRGWKRLAEARSGRMCAAAASYSEFTRGVLAEHRPSAVLALPSEVADSAVGEVPPGPRAGFAFVGRISAYKGLDFLLDAWEQAAGRLPDGEVLTILGGGEIDRPVPAGVVVRQGRYSDEDAAALLSGVRAVVLPYREASQSGVQVTALQCGTPVVSTRVGALPEFQAAGHPVVDFGDVAGLADALVDLAGRSDLRELSAAARERYRERHSRPAVRRALEALVGSL